MATTAINQFFMLIFLNLPFCFCISIILRFSLYFVSFNIHFYVFNNVFANSCNIFDCNKIKFIISYFYHFLQLNTLKILINHSQKIFSVKCILSTTRQLQILIKKDQPKRQTKKKCTWPKFWFMTRFVLWRYWLYPFCRIVLRIHIIW